MVEKKRLEIQGGTIVDLISYDFNRSHKFEIVECIGMGAEFIAYKAKCLDTTGTNYCVLKELFPFSLFKNSGLHRSEDRINIADKHNATLLEKYTVENNIIQEIEKIKSITTIDENNHISVRGVDDVLKSNSTYYIKVPYDGENTLPQKVKSLKEALFITREIAVMTQGLHDSGYLHLDIKPGNIQFNRIDAEGILGVPRLNFLDMGSFIPVEDVEQKNGDLTSSPGFSAPEQRHGHIDCKYPQTADIYSIGAVLFKMVMGSEPTSDDNDCCEFDFSSSEIVADQHIYIKTELNKLFVNTLSGDPDRRYKSARELIEQTDKILSALPSSQGYEALKSNKFESTENGFKWENEKEEYLYSLFKTISYNNKAYNSLFELLSELTYTESGDKKFFLVGPGADGKSSQLKRLCCDAVKGYYPFGYAPIYITSKDIRNIPDDHSGNLLDKAIEKKLNLTEDSQIVSEGLLIIIDGFNELNDNQQKRIETALEISKGSENIFIVSGRNYCEFTGKGFNLISVNSLDEETVRKVSGYDFDKYLVPGLIELLTNNIYFLKKLKDLKDKERRFETPSAILSYYYDVQINELVYSLKKSREHIVDDKSVYESKIKKAISNAAFAAYDVMSLSVKDKDFGLDLQTERDFVDEIKRMFFQSDLGKFEHDLIRDFIVADALKESVELCCEKSSAEYLDRHFSEELSDDVLKFLGELLEENKLSAKANKNVLKNYNNYCSELTESFWERFMNRNADVRWNNEKRQKYDSLTYVLFLVKNKRDKEKLKFNLIRAIVSGRGYDSLEDLLSGQVPEHTVRKSTPYNRLKEKYAKATNKTSFLFKHLKPVNKSTGGLKKLLLDLQVDIDTLDGYSLKSENIKYSNYIGAKARKKKRLIISAIAALVPVVLMLTFSIRYFSEPYPQIIPDSTWFQNETYSSECNLNVTFTIKDSTSNMLFIRDMVESDFIMKGFNAEIRVSALDNNNMLVTLSNLTPAEAEELKEKKHCQLFIKKDAVTVNGEGKTSLTNRGNYETEIADFYVYFSDTGEIESYIEGFNLVGEGGSQETFVAFYSDEPFESTLSVEDIEFYNFSADTLIKNIYKGSSEGFGNDVEVPLPKYVHAYSLVLNNIHSKNEDEKYIRVTGQSAKNQHGITSLSYQTPAFEVVDYFIWDSAPEIAYISLESEKDIPLGGGIRVDVDFSMEDSAWDTYFDSKLTTENISFEGLIVDKESIYISNFVYNNAHCYSIFISGIYPEEGASEYKITIGSGVAVSKSGKRNTPKSETLDITFIEEADTTAPAVTIPKPVFNEDVLSFKIATADNYVLPTIDTERISRNIMLTNAVYDKNITVKDDLGMRTEGQVFYVEIKDISIIDPSKNVELVVEPSAIVDAFGNYHKPIRITVWTPNHKGEYVDFKSAEKSPEKICLESTAITVDKNNCAYFTFKTSDPISVYDLNHIRFTGMSATKNIAAVSENEFSVKLSDIDISNEEGIVHIYYVDSLTKKVYVNELTVAKNNITE